MYISLYISLDELIVVDQRGRAGAMGDMGDIGRSAYRHFPGLIRQHLEGIQEVLGGLQTGVRHDLVEKYLKPLHRLYES